MEHYLALNCSTTCPGRYPARLDVQEDTLLGFLSRVERSLEVFLVPKYKCRGCSPFSEKKSMWVGEAVFSWWGPFLHGGGPVVSVRGPVFSLRGGGVSL